jgi:predicted nucleic acid-binding protein
LTVYVDSSFLVSLYLTDRHSPVSRQRVSTTSGMWLTPLHNAEWAHALGQHIFRKSLSSAEAQQMYEQFESDKAAGLWLETRIPDQAFESCAELARRYGPKLGIRTLDSLHVACALELQAEKFWTLDERQAKLAKAEGLKIS